MNSQKTWDKEETRIECSDYKKPMLRIIPKGNFILAVLSHNACTSLLEYKY